ncbi:PTS sugar transporter subunit IIB [Tetragenococcus halophilus]|uniref:Phosphotransferase system enzyme IIB component n=2 Tax=Tetragenococcus halophilus TaxID=51669 RepID=A0AAN1SI06_TETHN|nr:PTS sugar transporter subunit IIB [Tetragenococcus halophilus]MCO8287453.1 PTS sugar transporter subunit IIB [Tetragenococcus halophilus]MCO8290904.1 PTS sugar transporter subunit IIB [Tetragenococcus halophilus]MCT8310016.1 PTS sugar transporter subunit IIB [Tetragenococcus halophilus]QGP76079.1 PTS galactitol transporter subunit IIB [Tetragenococcus halophilus]QXN87394.1 PTS sugar transporter subunit IIB [Tetragenococcus halophilus]
MKKIIVACGSGVATSQTVASKLSKLLKERKITADVEAVDIKSLKHHVKNADAYVSIVKSKEEFDIPVFNGVAFLTGMGQEEELQKIINLIEED